MRNLAEIENGESFLGKVPKLNPLDDTDDEVDGDGEENKLDVNDGDEA